MVGGFDATLANLVGPSTMLALLYPIGSGDRKIETREHIGFHLPHALSLVSNLFFGESFLVVQKYWVSLQLSGRLTYFRNFETPIHSNLDKFCS